MLKITPHTTTGWIRVAILFVLFISCAFWLRLDRLTTYYASDKREGDIVFQSLPHGDLVDAIEGITRSEWSHCGILTKIDGAWFVAEALGTVHYTPVSSSRWSLEKRPWIVR